MSARSRQDIAVGVVVFPGSCDDHDTYHALAHVLDVRARFVWHKEESLEGLDAVLLPGGFSYGDYLRCGAMAKFSPVMKAVRRFAQDGGFVLGTCNGFQILCEAGLLPGALIRNRSLRFLCEPRQPLRVERGDTAWTSRVEKGRVLRIPIKHGEGCYYADPSTLDALQANGQILLRYSTPDGRIREEANPNGSLLNIAGIMSPRGNVFGLMPHPEHAVEPRLGGEDGRRILDGLIDALVAAPARPSLGAAPAARPVAPPIVSR